MFKLDFKNFKKVGSDQVSTTLQHPDGHTIKIAHVSVHPKVREQLAALPMHKAEGGMIQQGGPEVALKENYKKSSPKKMADGGDVDKKNKQDDEPIGKKIGYPGFANGGQVEAAKKQISKEVPYKDGGEVSR